MEYKQFITKFFENKEKFLKEQLDGFETCLDDTITKALEEITLQKEIKQRQIKQLGEEYTEIMIKIKRNKTTLIKSNKEVTDIQEQLKKITELKDREINEIKELNIDKKEQIKRVQYITAKEKELEGKELTISTKENLLNQKEKILKRITNGKLN